MILALLLALRLPQDAEIRKLLGGLAHDDLEVRERAENGLVDLGVPAVPALHKAESSETPETAARARAVLSRIASKLLSSFESSIAASKGLTIQFAFRGVDVSKGVEGSPKEVEGTIRLAPKGRFRLDITRSAGLSESDERRVVADGANLLIETSGGKSETVPSPTLLAEGVRVLSPGIGLPASLWCLPRPGTFERFKGAKTDPPLISLFGKSVRSKMTRTHPTIRPGSGGLEIAFKVILDQSDPGDACEVVLTLDASSLLPRSRTVKHSHPDPDLVFRTTETFVHWTEGEVAEDAFRIPSK